MFLLCQNSYGLVKKKKNNLELFEVFVGFFWCCVVLDWFGLVFFKQFVLAN